MKVKFLVLLFSVVCCLSSEASMGRDDLVKSIRGSYILQTNEVGEIHFLIRSTGELQVIKSDWYSVSESTSKYPSKMSIERGDNGLLRGMPVAHLIFAEGADEQAIDFHLLITAEQGWSGGNPRVRLLSSFALENDGPNELATIISTKLLLLKYSKSAKKFIPVK
mgnify:CR=1 FL=1